MPLSSTLDYVRQRTGTQDLHTRTGLSQFQSAVRTDFGGVSSQWNQVIYPLLSTIAEPGGLDALSKGLGGNILWSDVDSTSGSSSLFWDTATARKRTIKESFDWIITELNRLQIAGVTNPALMEYEAEADAIWGSWITNVYDALTVVSYGSGAFSLTAYPNLDGILWLNAGTWEQAQADDELGGAGAFKAIQRQTESGIKFMLRQGKTVIDDSLFDAAPSAGDAIYVSEVTPGNFTATAPSASGETVQAVGYVLSYSAPDVECYIDIQDNYTLVP